jgi:hypothetical protein
MTTEKRDRKEINRCTRRLNVELAKLCRSYYDHLPIVRISNLVEEWGFSADELEGIYCGHEGRVHQCIGDGKYIVVIWARVGDNNRFEINSYVS